MSADTTPTETMKFTQARQRLSEVVNRVAKHEVRILVEKNGIPVAAIVTADDLEDLKRLQARREEQFAAIGRISDAFADVPLDELDRQVDLAVQAVRSRKRDAADRP